MPGIWLSHLKLLPGFYLFLLRKLLEIKDILRHYLEITFWRLHLIQHTLCYPPSPSPRPQPPPPPIIVYAIVAEKRQEKSSLSFIHQED